MPKPPRAEAKQHAEPEPAAEEECVSLSRVTELLEQQKDMFKEILQQQQENFKCFIKIIMETTDTRLDGITRDIQELKTSLEFTQGDVDKLKEEKAKLTERSSTLQTDVYKVCDSLLTITDKMEYLEGQSRRERPGPTQRKKSERY